MVVQNFKNYFVFIMDANKRTSLTMPFGYGKLKTKRLKNRRNPGVTYRKDSHKVQLSRIMRYYVELQVLDISIVLRVSDLLALGPLCYCQVD